MKSALHHYAILFFLAALLAFASFGRASGPAFPGLSAASSGQAEVYVYRRHSYAALAQPFTVLLDSQPVGKLFNASYLKLSMPPGAHRLEVAPGGMARTSRLALRAEANARSFYEFDFPGGWKMRPSFNGAEIAPRSENDALEAMRTLRSAS
jgi:hypothetical protein